MGKKKSVSRHLKHLIFFDDACPLCWRSINKIFTLDHGKVFQFLPLKDPRTKTILKSRWHGLKNANTLILLENNSSGEGKIWIRGRAVMRILWLLGGWWKLLGWLAFIPFGVDTLYDWVAERRHRL